MKYPHEGACPKCREERVCNACGGAIGSFASSRPQRCTNGRCLACDRKYCGFGSSTEPGHGFWRTPTKVFPHTERAPNAYVPWSERQREGVQS